MRFVRATRYLDRLNLLLGAATGLFFAGLARMLWTIYGN